MFYVSSISGTLVPLDPRAAPLSGAGASSGTVQSTPLAAQLVSEAQVFEAIAARELALSSRAASSASPSPSASASEDAAVYTPGSEVGKFGALQRSSQNVSDAPHIGRAGAAMAYRTQNAEFRSQAPSSETILPIGSSASPPILEDAPESPQRVDPIKDQRPRYQSPPKQRKKVVVAADIMSSPVFAFHEHASLEEARVVFREKRFRHVPVLSAAGKLIGVLSDRDILGEAPSRTGTPAEVRDRMSTNVISARPETEIHAIAQVMVEHRVGCLPILDEAGALVGMLTRGDILRAIVSHAPIELWT
jgi:CBS domain-containing protein